MTGPVRVFPLAPVLDLCPAPGHGVLGTEVSDVVALVVQHLESAGIELHLSPADLEVAIGPASDLLHVLSAGSTRVVTPAVVDDAWREKR